MHPIDNNQTNWLAALQSGQIDNAGLKINMDSYQTAISGLEAEKWPVSVISDMEAEISAFQVWANDLGVIFSDVQLGNPLPDQATIQQYGADFQVVHAAAIKVRGDLGVSATAS